MAPVVTEVHFNLVVLHHCGTPPFKNPSQLGQQLQTSFSLHYKLSGYKDPLPAGAFLINYTRGLIVARPANTVPQRGGTLHGLVSYPELALSCGTIACP